MGPRDLFEGRAAWGPSRFESQAEGVRLHRTQDGTQRRCARMCARMEAQRVRKPFSVFTPRVTNYSIFHLLGKTRPVVSVLQSQACCQLHQGAAFTWS